MVEGARLESVYTGNRIKGSNPFVSAPTAQALAKAVFLLKYLTNYFKNSRFCNWQIIPAPLPLRPEKNPHFNKD